MKTIVRMKFGSHLYGTDTPQSDVDFKGVFIPPARDILLQRIADTISTQRPKGEGEKNYAGEHDEEQYSVQKYLRLVSEGQPVALDMLFAPPETLVNRTDDWVVILRNRDRLLTRKSAAFVGYCRHQANKYGIKGSRVAASRVALELLNRALHDQGTVAKLATIRDAVTTLTAEQEHMEMIDVPQVSGRTVAHWSVCGRRMPLSSSIKSAQTVMQRLVDEYGHRALRAERNEGIDWKALSHAVRVGGQAIEMLRDHRFTFPRPNAAHLIAIKQGRIPYTDVSAEIEQLLGEVERVAAESALPDEPDRQWIDDYVALVHRNAIHGG